MKRNQPRARPGPQQQPPQPPQLPKSPRAPTTTAPSVKAKGILDSTARKIAAALFTTGIAIGSIIHFSSEKSEKPAEVSVDTNVPTPSATSRATPREPTTEGFEKQDRQIAIIEKAFIEFAQKISQKAATRAPKKIADNIKIPDDLSIPLETVTTNLGNPVKNIGPMEALAAKGKPIVMKSVASEHFYYRLENIPGGIGAAYKDIARTVSLDKNFDPRNVIQMFFLYHELLHVKEDEQRKGKMKKGEMPNYPDTLLLTVTSPGPIAFLEDEVRANAITLMAIDAYFDGALEKLGADATDEDIAKLFQNVTPSAGADSAKMDNFFSMIRGQTNVFYNAEKSESERLENFRKLIAMIHIKGGFKLYTLRPDGGPQAL